MTLFVLVCAFLLLAYGIGYAHSEIRGLEERVSKLEEEVQELREKAQLE